ncbi:MAG TPA: cell wall hydrolase [Pseudolabrys sp.]|nr:cell wall hydrolase [Pseudolabrys sp.]
MTKVTLIALGMVLSPAQAAFSDLGALLAHQPGVAARAQKFALSLPLGAIHAATFSLPRPIGTSLPHPPIYALANFDPSDIATSIGAQMLGDASAPLQFPTVNRKDKRDFLARRRRTPLPPLPAMLAIQPMPETEIEIGLKPEGANGPIDAFGQYVFGAVPDRMSDKAASVASRASSTAPYRKDSRETARIFFGGEPLVSEEEEITPWAPGYAPMVSERGSGDIKFASLDPQQLYDELAGGQSVANKGEVTGADQRPESPAVRLKLTGDKRARAEKCLADAVYFEARGESVRGQIAVAQVVMNRVFSSFYPDSVCGVVYQNAGRHLACQFTFACDGIPERVTEPEAWARAKRIARDMLDGKLWLPEVAKSTHYHAYWVHPNWVGEMRKMFKIGVHTFYRPRAWGDGSDEPSWGDPSTTARETKIIKKL